jgi:hypothetical protein
MTLTPFPIEPLESELAGKGMKNRRARADPIIDIRASKMVAFMAAVRKGYCHDHAGFSDGFRSRGR